jgi:hypothetical protein
MPFPNDKFVAQRKINAGYPQNLILKGTYPGADNEVPVISYYTHPRALKYHREARVL